ncbi:hypothetical protein ABFS82_02G140700 [Erythranthe guttata]|uniref:Fe2OG dioxygenase domain-containing protein n=1 Tax=Erythranthe guttata TaxID=4155 RepID=A0A022RIV5_ERYGU|nr:hypothetical protein MIMGU_mgv1a009244mg [Erythranthe guttata]
MTVSQMRRRNVPQRYILPLQHRPTLTDRNPMQQHCFFTRPLPVIDLSSLDNPLLRSRLVGQVSLACKEFGFFQVINHGIPVSLTKDALDVAQEFFDLPNETKMRLASDNVCKPVRYGTSLNHVKDKVQYWRDFIKHYSQPISTWIDSWPSDPPTYKQKMGKYTKAINDLHKKLMGLVFESLGLKPDYLKKEVEQGSQVTAVNYYPSCPEPSLALGLPPHTDYGLLTILLQNQQGLQIMDKTGNWQSVPVIKGGLVVQLGDHMEVLSNGRYRGVVHRAVLNSEKNRISIANIQSLSMDTKVGPASELVDKRYPVMYEEASFGGFLKFISGNNIREEKYIDTLRKQKSIR